MEDAYFGGFCGLLGAASPCSATNPPSFHRRAAPRALSRRKGSDSSNASLTGASKPIRTALTPQRAGSRLAGGHSAPPLSRLPRSRPHGRHPSSSASGAGQSAAAPGPVQTPAAVGERSAAEAPRGWLTKGPLPSACGCGRSSPGEGEGEGLGGVGVRVRVELVSLAGGFVS